MSIFDDILLTVASESSAFSCEGDKENGKFTRVKLGAFLFDADADADTHAAAAATAAAAAAASAVS